MLSEKYVEKQQKYYKFYEFIYRFRICFIILLAILVAISATLMGIKGIVINDVIVSDVTYGSKLEYKSKAIFGNILYYEFREENSDKWTRNEPNLIGNYYLRGVSKSLFGNIRYGKEEAFTINPLSIELDASTSIEYGSKAVILANLQYSDYVSNCEYEIISSSDEIRKFNCKIDQESFKIINNNGVDVTYCYNIQFKDTYEFNFTPKSITVSSTYECIYDGKSHISSEVKLIKGELVDKDEIKIDNQDSFIEVGKHINKPRLKIINSNNVDVTNLYNVNYSTDSYLTITKRPITIETLDFKKEYDGTNYAYESSYKIKEGSLINGDIIHVFTPYVEDVGTYSNKGDYYITSNKNVDVTSNYEITIIPGEYVITPKKATIEVFCESKEYNGEWNDNLSYKENNLIDSHYVILESDKEYAYAKTYGSHDVKVNIFNGASKDVTKNYELTIKYPNGFTITKRPLGIKTESDSFEYDGEYKYSLEYEIINGSILENETIEVSKYSMYKEVGKYDNILNFKITNPVLGDVTDCYNITVEDGTIEIYSAKKETESIGQSDGHLFYYEAKSRGTVFITEKINFGNYNGKTFDKITGYTINSEYNPEEFVSTLLSGYANDAKGTIILPRNRCRSKDYYLNYPKFDRPQKIDTKVQISDLYHGTYEVNGLHYNYLQNPELLDNIKTTSSFDKAEADYRKYVKENYTGIDSYTYNYLKNYIEEYDLDGGSINLTAKKLIKHIKKYFKYSIFDEDIIAPDKEHPFVSFLRDTKVGKCDYFATFGTLLFRTLGYSARMITGYSTGGNELKTYDVTGMDGHAICQVYIDGKGWVNFEFTVAPSLSLDGDDRDGDAIENWDIQIMSNGLEATYDGKYHKDDKLSITSYIKNIKVEKYFNEGYIKAGKYNNIFDCIVYDSKGNILDEDFYNIDKKFGIIEISQKEIEVNKITFNGSCNDLSGRILTKTITNCNFLVSGDKIEEFHIFNATPGNELGHTFTYKAIISRITNSNGEDVTNCYKKKMINVIVTYVS